MQKLRTPRLREGEVRRTEAAEKESDYAIPNARVIGEQYNIVIDDSAAERKQKEEEDRKTRAIFNAIEDQSAFVVQQEQLQQQIDKKNREIDRLMVLLEACEPVPGINIEKFNKLLASTDENCDYRDSKIVDLAKKVRRLTVAVNKERSVNEASASTIAELTAKVSQLQQEADNNAFATARATSSKSGRSQSASDRGGADASEDSLPRLQKELLLSQRQNEELKKKLSAAVEESKGLNRALMRELGDGVTVEQAVDGGWRGRAQQIVMLKSKIKKLEALSAAGIAPGATAAATSRARNDVDAKAEGELVGMSNDRKQAVEAITEENVRLQEKCAELETKQKGNKARIKNLEGELSKQKQQLQILVEKATSDDELVEAFKEEVKKLRDTVQQLHAERRARMEQGGRDAGEQFITRSKMNADGTMSTIRSAVMAGSSNVVDEAKAAADEMEIHRLKRLCKQQAEQLSTQDRMIQQLRAGRSSLLDDY